MMVGVVLLGIFCDFPAYADTGKNIALHCSYTLKPSPNYPLCDSIGDNSLKLTDGLYTNDRANIWTGGDTVCWEGAGSVLISVDLGSVKAISGASYSTAAGYAQVTFPKNIFILVSDDEVTWNYAGDLTNLSAQAGGGGSPPPPTGKAIKFRYSTPALQTHGRYVCFAVVGSPYILCDEIEVYEGELGLLGQTLPGPSSTGPDSLNKMVLSLIKNSSAPAAAQ